MTSAQLDPKAMGARRFADKVCIVTGAGQGIGRATARRLGQEGGKIVVAERVEATARETFTQLTDHGVDAMLAVADVSTSAGADKLMSDTLARYGRIDVLVNVVGGTIWWQPFHLYSEEQITLELERSLHTALWCCHAALPHMIRQKSGSIVNLGSSVVKGALYRVPYAVSKGAIEALTRTLAAENGRYGIRVNTVAPGSTTSPDRVTSRLTLKPGQVAQEAADTNVYYEETRKVKNRAIDRQGSVDEQAAAIAFLASDDASYITGQTLYVDGGSN